MKSAFVILSAVACSAYTRLEKEAALEEVVAAGYPHLNAFIADRWTPALLSTFIKKELEVVGSQLEHVSALEKETIFATVSASNSCEYCLSFHSMGMSKGGASEADINAVLDGGLPTHEGLRGVATAAKLALAHKGIFLPNEKAHLKAKWGIGPQKLLEIVYLAGQIEANNRLMVHMISEGINVDDFLRPFTPFKHSVYHLDEKDL